MQLLKFYCSPEPCSVKWRMKGLSFKKRIADIYLWNRFVLHINEYPHYIKKLKTFSLEVCTDFICNNMVYYVDVTLGSDTSHGKWNWYSVHVCLYLFTCIYYYIYDKLYLFCVCNTPLQRESLLPNPRMQLWSV